MPIFIAFTCCLILNAASQLLENSNPSLAATLNPLNTDARINVLVGDFNLSDPPPAAELAARAAALVYLAPADARGYSLIGAAQERQGDMAAATESFRAALAHSRTERYALMHLLSFSLSDGDAAASVRYFDLLLRRWSEFSGEVMPIVFDFLKTPERMAALEAALVQFPPWRNAAIWQLTLRPEGARFVSNVLIRHPERTRNWDDEVGRTISALIDMGGPALAYALFQQTLLPEEAAVSGYVYDSGFTRQSGGRAFEWRIGRSSGADLRLPAGPDQPGLRLRFLQSPATLGTPSQNLYLPPGDYVLEATADGSALRLPKGLYWRINCFGGSGEVTRLDLDEGTYRQASRQVRFFVPAGCAMQSLTLETGVTTSSWRDRYDGDITITNVRVSRFRGPA